MGVEIGLFYSIYRSGSGQYIHTYTLSLLAKQRSLYRIEMFLCSHACGNGDIGHRSTMMNHPNQARESASSRGRCVVCIVESCHPLVRPTRPDGLTAVLCSRQLAPAATFSSLMPGCVHAWMPGRRRRAAHFSLRQRQGAALSLELCCEAFHKLTGIIYPVRRFCSAVAHTEVKQHTSHPSQLRQKATRYKPLSTS